MTPVSQSSSDVAAAYEKLCLTLKKKLRQQRVKRPSLSLFFGFFFFGLDQKCEPAAELALAPLARPSSSAAWVAV